MTINLLPEENKKEIGREKMWKKVFIILIFILVFILILISVLFCIKDYLSLKIKPLNISLMDKQEKISSFNSQDFQGLTIKTNENLLKIKEFKEKRVLFVPVFEKIDLLAKGSIYLTNASFQKNVQEKETVVNVNIDGRAKSREDLFYFKESLGKEENFKDVYFSPGSWVEPINVLFSLSFILKTDDF